MYVLPNANGIVVHMDVCNVSIFYATPLAFVWEYFIICTCRNNSKQLPLERRRCLVYLLGAITN